MYQKLDTLFKDGDTIFLTSPHNLRYFTGFRGGEGCAIIFPNVRYLLVDSRYTVAAKEEATDYTVITYGAKSLQSLCHEIFTSHGAKKCIFEDNTMSYAEYIKISSWFPTLKWTGKSDEIEKLRMIKTEDELALIRKAEQIGDLAFSHILNYLKPGISEMDIAAEIEYAMRKNGASKTSFDTIAVSGEKTSMPHGIPGQKKLMPGDLLTMDFGCIYEGYCSDMTRTVGISHLGRKEKEIYAVVKKAQEAGLFAIRSGISGKEADTAARKVIQEAGFGEYFGHSLGHGVGLLIHELPNLSPGSNIMLEENMVVSCEPGIYIEGIGGVRIEDLVCVKKDGIENFTHSPKDLIIIE